VLGSHSKAKHKNNENFPISLSPLAPRICSHIVSFKPEFPILAFFLMLEPEVTLGLIAGAEPDAHQFNVTICLKGVIKWKETQNNVASTQKLGQACMNE
jgi:hypothetical protein